MRALLEDLQHPVKKEAAMATVQMQITITQEKGQSPLTLRYINALVQGALDQFTTYLPNDDPAYMTKCQVEEAFTKEVA